MSNVVLIDFGQPVALSALRWIDPLEAQHSSISDRLNIHECSRAVLGEMIFLEGGTSFDSYILEDVIAFESCINRAIYAGSARVGLCDGVLVCDVKIKNNTIVVEILRDEEQIFRGEGGLAKVGGDLFLARAWLVGQVNILGRSGWWDENLKQLLTRDW